jgi:amyloid beta precursor protein binding protein 1
MNLRLLDNPVTDLRIVNPWKELKEYAMSFDLTNMEDVRHSHIPYIIILIQALEKYKETVKITNIA